jgi:hypothetical protein
MTIMATPVIITPGVGMIGVLSITGMMNLVLYEVIMGNDVCGTIARDLNSVFVVAYGIF